MRLEKFTAPPSGMFFTTPCIKWLAYSPRLAVEMGSFVDDEAYGWAWKPYGWFDPARRPREIIHILAYMADGPVRG